MKQSLIAFSATFGIAFLVYAVLRQDCFYRHDGWGFFTAIDQGQPFHSAHPFYLPLTRAWCGMLAILGIGTFAAAGLFSAFGTAVGVAIHALSLRRLGRTDWVLGTAWVALCPAVLFFSTVVEIHGVFFAVASLSFYLTVVLVDTKSPLTAGALGCSLTVGFFVHTSGILLPLLYLPWYLRRARWDGRLIGTAVAAGVLALFSFAYLLRSVGGRKGPPSFGSAEDVLGSLQNIAAESHRFDDVLWTEWLWPFFPVSLLIVIALFWKKWRFDGAVLLLTLLPYLVTCMLLLQETSETGAYLLPWILPASVLALDLLRPKTAYFVVFCGALFGVRGIISHERTREVDPEWANSVAQTCGDESSYVMIWDDGEMDSLLLHADSDRIQPLFMRPYAMYSPQDQRQMLQLYGRMLEDRPQLFVSTATHNGLADPLGSQSGPIILKWLELKQPHVLLDARGQRADLPDDSKNEDR